MAMAVGIDVIPVSLHSMAHTPKTPLRTTQPTPATKFAREIDLMTWFENDETVEKNNWKRPVMTCWRIQIPSKSLESKQAERARRRLQPKHRLCPLRWRPGSLIGSIEKTFKPLTASLWMGWTAKMSDATKDRPDPSPKVARQTACMRPQDTP